ncbi:MAG: hypothetical protein JWM78_3206 [Verrucomicrobiaceae bacterium]|nr:hypothetical protein [Verrucomicrobiaceae bacterium]
MAAAVVTKKRLLIVAALLASSAPLLFAAILPEERMDVLYHRYDGGGLTVDGPSVLVRKNIADKFSVSGNYYVDNVSSASIDVITQASPFADKRTEESLSLDYLFDRTMMTAGMIHSSESDYLSNTVHFDISQDFFGDLTTLSMGYTRGSDTIKSNSNAAFKETATHQEYRVSVSQIVTRNLIVNLSEEIISDEGFLANPYRSFRYVNGSSYSWQQEIFPQARTSYTTTLGAKYHLPDTRAALYGSYRYYNDGWDIKSNTLEVGYEHALPHGWIFDIHARYYKQNEANFYSDLFSNATEFKYMTRDKQLSAFHSMAAGVGITYELPFKNSLIEKSSINLYWDHLKFDYENYRNATIKGVAPGTEPLYSFDADVIRFFISVWY